MLLTSKQLLTRSFGKDGHIRQRMHTLRRLDGQCAVDDESSDGVFVVDDVIVLLLRGADGGDSGAILVDLIIFTMVGVRADGGVQGVATYPSSQIIISAVEKW